MNLVKIEKAYSISLAIIVLFSLISRPFFKAIILKK